MCKNRADAKFLDLLLITESADTTIEVHDSLMIQCYDLITIHEEVGTAIVKQYYNLVQSDVLFMVQIISDNVFVIACNCLPKNICHGVDESY